ncbi:MAG: CusA/CzcA family heavy metal efflux RND transporter [Muribaculaceae bacterium]|nr:CusA/CzcA family heavy metal efflux RND transporter [Muribaculaceae bacterium]
MLNKIIKASLRNRLVVLGLTCVLLVAGLITLMRMDVDIFPDLNAPTVVIMTEAPGLAAEEVENIVTYPVETAVNGSNGVRRVRSSSTTGFSVVWVEFEWGTDVYRARQIVAERLESMSANLPAGVSKPVMGPQSSILGEVMIIGLTSDSASMLELRRIADTAVRPRLLALGGVSQVTVLGGDAPEYQIKLDPGRMLAYGVSLSEAMDAAESVNDNARGGIVYDFGNEYIVKARLNSTDPADIARAVVRANPATGQIITIGDIATVEVDGRRPRTGLASVEGRPAVLVTVTKQPEQGTISLTENIDRELADIADALPGSVVLNTDIFRQSDFIDASVSNLQESLFQGAVFVIIVLFIFLMNIRTTVISVIAIPLSIIVTVLILNFMGYSINTMVLGGIAIAIGCLVDDAIVDVENVYKRLRQNRLLPQAERKSLLDVVYHASAEVRMPIFNSTLIIVAAFLPLFFLSGIEGRLLRPLGVSFIVALAASTIVALTLTPVLCTFLLGSGKENAGENAEISREPALTRHLRAAYTRSLRFSLSHTRTLLISTASVFAISLCLFFTLGRSFLPAFNEGSFTINISALPGISLDESDRIGREAERIIMDIPEVRTVARKTGRAELDEHSRGANGSEIEAPYVLDKGRTRSEVSADLRKRLGELPGVVVEIGQPISHRIDAMLSGTQAQIAIKIFGPELPVLVNLGHEIQKVIKEVPGVVDANVEQLIERPEIVITPRREMLAMYGIRMADFNRAISVALGGAEVSEVYDGGFSYAVSVVLDPRFRDGIADIARLTVDGAEGPVALSEIAEIASTTGPNGINRENVRRRLTVSANVEDRDLHGTVADIQKKIAADVKLPEGYFLSYGGQFESEEQASRTLLWTSLGALLLIFMLLYGEFKNTAQALTILVNMPLALIGAVLLLVCVGKPLNIPAIIGFISLMGITTRNGMLLMSRYNKLREDGLPLETRILEGSSDRLLPIVMTALTSALALVPIALGADEPGNEIQAPMALVILGGLISSTVLNVYVVPAVYKILNEKNR